MRRGAEVPDAPRGKNKGESIEDECPFVADGNDGGAKKSADGEGHPLRGLGKRVRVWISSGLAMVGRMRNVLR